MLEALEWCAVLAFAWYGVLKAARLGLDAVGFVTLAGLTAFGGGTLRDLCLDRTPPFWIEHERFTAVVLALALAASLAPQAARRCERLLVVPDTLGLALYAVTGAGYALAAGTGPLTAVIMGVMTGCFGGVIADVVGNQTPSLFRAASPLYATCAAAGAGLYTALHHLDQPQLGAGLGFLLAVTLRGLALRWGWHLPHAGGASPPPHP